MGEDSKPASPPPAAPAAAPAPADKKKPAASGGYGKTVKSLIAGGTAGAIEVMIMYPTEYVKTQLQLAQKSTVGGKPQYAGPIDCARSIVRERGFFALYRGITTLIVGSIPKAGVRFAAFENISKLLQDEKGKLSPGANMLAGSIAGAAEAIIAVTPMETLKTKMIHDQNQPNPKYKGLVHATTTIVRTEGIRGLYQGVVPTVLKQSGNQMVRFTVFGQIKTLLQGPNASANQKLPPWQSFLAGGLAGAISVYATMPVDVVKTRMQGLEAKQYSSSWNCFTSIIKNEGVVALWKGTVPRLSRVMFSGAIIFTCYEEISKFLNQFISD